MVPSRRTLAPVAIFSSVFLAAAGHATARGAADVLRITAAANLAMRQTPGPQATVIAFVPLGTELTEVGPLGLDKTWLHVRLADNREGWVLASLTRPLDPARRWPTVERIVTDRLARHGDSFPAAMELVDFVERASRQIADNETAARFDLYHLRAVASAAADIRFGHEKQEPYWSWLDRYRGLVVRDDPSGRWMLAPNAIWEVHDRHAASVAADDIAWLATTTGLPGECEGELACYAESADLLGGRYLRAHPAGRHADEAVRMVAEVTVRLGDAGSRSLYTFDRARDCARLGQAIDGLRAALTGTSAAGRDAPLQQLAALRSVCGPAD